MILKAVKAGFGVKADSGIPSAGFLEEGRSVETVEFLTGRAYTLSSFALTCAVLIAAPLTSSSDRPKTRRKRIPAITVDLWLGSVVFLLPRVG